MKLLELPENLKYTVDTRGFPLKHFHGGVSVVGGGSGGRQHSYHFERAHLHHNILKSDKQQNINAILYIFQLLGDK